MPVTLQHRLRAMIPYNLDHAGYCAALGRCECGSIETRVHVRKPAPGLEVKTKSTPPVLTLFARETRRGLPAAVLAAESIKAAIARGDIRVLEQTPDRPGTPRTR